MSNAWTYTATCQTLGLTNQMEWFRTQWDQAAEAFDPAGDWLPTEAQAAEYCAWIGMTDEVSRLVVQGVREVRHKPALVMLAWQYYWAMFLPAAIRPWTPVPWFMLPPAPPEQDFAGRMFQAVVILSGIPRYRTEHAARGIPEKISRDNLLGIELWMHNYRQRFGQWGFDRGSWLANHITDRLVRMQRLEFGLSRFAFGFTLLRERCGEHRVVALADSGLRLRQDGRYQNAQGTPADDPGWGTYLMGNEKTITGYPVVEPNVVAREPVTLDLSQWEVVLQAGDPVLDIHIPARGKMDIAACDESFAQAMTFFPRYYPEHVFKAFTCGSWLVDPQLAQQMPGSNMAHFAQRYHHLPADGANDGQVYDLGLGGRCPLDKAPKDTTLRRILVEHMGKGGQWWYTNGVILREECAATAGGHRRLPGV